MIRNIQTFARYFHNLGLNISCISKPLNIEYLNQAQYMKKPDPEYSLYYDKRQELNELDGLSWSNATGLGLILGFNDFMCIDLDRCTSIKFVKCLLEILELPDNYEWVVKTGSGSGYHIIVQSPFKPNLVESSEIGIDHWGDYKEFENDRIYPDVEFINSLYDSNYKISSFRSYIPYLEKIEFLWKEHCLLPPSYHKSGLQYCFVFKELPESMPKFVSPTRIYNLFHKVVLNNKSGVEKLISSIDQQETKSYLDPSERFEIALKDNLVTNLSGYKHNDLTIIIDTETNGLPLKSNAPFYDTDNWPELLQVAWIITNGWDVIYQNNSIIKYNSITISPEIQKLTGINEQIIKTIGREPETVINLFLNDLNKCNKIVAHNIEFDIKVLKSFFFRLGLSLNLSEKKLICTMDRAFKNKSKIKDYNQDRFLKNAELVKLLKIDSDNEMLHNAVYDAYLTYKCYQRLNEILGYPDLNLPF